jgi:nucleotide-binding universal stress UspA family protein
VKVPERIEVVLVPSDGSFLSGRGAMAGAVLADRLGAEVEVLSTVEKVDDIPRREDELDKLERWVPAAKRKIAVDLDPAGEIHEELRRLGNAIACMASHGRGRSAALVGSVAADVLARAHDPIVLAGHLVERPPTGHGVVACVDDDPASATVLPVAMRYAELLGEPPTILTVAEPAPPPTRPDRPTRRAFGPDDDVDAFLDGLAEPFRARGIEVETRAVYDPISPAVGIETYLRDNQAQLLVLASHARSGLARLALGSAAAAIVRHSASPVLVIPLAASGAQK